MNYRNQHRGGNLFSAIEHQQEVAKREVGILKLRSIIAWNSFRPLLEELLGYDKRDGKKSGRPPFDPVFMLKVLILQKYHGLSDEATEQQIKDRISFLTFLGLQLGDHVPDANTIWDFKELLEKDGKQGTQKIFAAFHQVLEKEKLIAKEGSIVDASFIEAPRQRNSREENQQIKQGERPTGFETHTAKGKQKDCDARWTKKNNQSHYGYKNHIKIDAKTKLIDKQITTPASVHDSQVFQQLVDQSDNCVLADSAYHSQEHETYLLETCDAQDFIMRKNLRGNPLTEAEQKTNHRISKIRVRVEHIFARIKQMGGNLVRAIGLKRASQHNTLSNLTYNMTRYAYLSK